MYKVKFYKGNYGKRQRDANNDDCIAYVEHHFNSVSSPSASYAVVIVGSNASQTSQNWGRWYSKAIATEFGIDIGGNDGIVIGGYGGRGDGNVKHTKMPAILLEPLFASNPQHAEWIRSEEGQDTMAQILKESIERFFPQGGLVAFSVGHKYKTSNPNDRGAAVFGGGTEADNAEKVLKKAKKLLESADKIAIKRKLRVMEGDKEIWAKEVDEDSIITWDSSRGLLKINNS